MEGEVSWSWHVSFCLTPLGFGDRWISNASASTVLKRSRHHLTIDVVAFPLRRKYNSWPQMGQLQLLKCFRLCISACARTELAFLREHRGKAGRYLHSSWRDFTSKAQRLWQISVYCLSIYPRCQPATMKPTKAEVSTASAQAQPHDAMHISSPRITG